MSVDRCGLSGPDGGARLGQYRGERAESAAQHKTPRKNKAPAGKEPAGASVRACSLLTTHNPQRISQAELFVLLVAVHELLHAASGVEQYVLTRVEGVRLAANFHLDDGVGFAVLH